MNLRPTEKRALARVLRYTVVPAALVMLDTVNGYLQTGSLEIDWKVVAIAGVTALLAGVSKWVREELGTDVKVV